LEPSASLLECILATITNPIFVCDRSGQLLYLNPLGARLLGLESSTALQQTIQAFAFTPELQAKLTLQLEVVFTTGHSLTSAMSFLTPADGLRDYEYTPSPIQGTMEHIEAVVCHTQDKTEERKRLEVILRAVSRKA
jgi:PAS domain S-box-containing protein